MTSRAVARICQELNMSPTDLIHVSAGMVTLTPEQIAEFAEDLDMMGCCMGAAVYGPHRCTCWVPVYDLDQTEALALDAPTQTRTDMCQDCAYRAGSPELSDERRDHLMTIPHGENPFWCHQGMRRPAQWRHPSGKVIDGSPDDYQPPEAQGRPYRADGMPGMICAGWAKRHEKVKR